MKLQQKLAYAGWHAQQQNKEFIRGEQDCLTSFLEMHDTVYGTDALKDIHSKYWDTRSAIRFYREFNLTWRQWLTINKWTEVEGTGQEGDIRVVDSKRYPTVYQKHNGYWWTQHEQHGWASFTDNAWDGGNYTHWRR